MYYLRTRAAADAIKFTVDQQALAKNKAARTAKLAAASEVGKELKVRQQVVLMLVTVVACRDCVSGGLHVVCLPAWYSLLCFTKVAGE